MTSPNSEGIGTERRAPDDDSRPHTALERQESLSKRILRMQRRRRERFLRRAQLFSLRQEALRAGYLVSCLFVDALVIPEPARLLPSPWVWAVVIVAFVGAVYIEYRIYHRYFGLPHLAKT